jgi:hypothetical protein
VRRLLGRRAYLGEVHHGTELLNIKAHEPLTSLATWLAANGEHPRGRQPEHRYPLSGLARCESCGGPMVGQTSNPRRDGTVARRYRCATRWNNGSGPCTAPASCLAEPLEELVRTTLEGLLDVPASVTDDPAPGLERELEALEADRVAFATNLDYQRDFGPTAFAEGIRARAAEVDRVQQRLAEVRAEQRGIQISEADLSDPAQLRRAVQQGIIGEISVAQGRGDLRSRTYFTLGDIDQ